MAYLKGIKHISIDIQYRTETDLKEQLMLVLKNAKEGQQKFFYQCKLNKKKTEYEMTFLNEFQFEEKTIDGQLTMVIQSKLNK